MTSTAIDALDAARRALNAVKRMRRHAARAARGDLISYVDEVMAEEEEVVGQAVEKLLKSSMGMTAEA